MSTRRKDMWKLLYNLVNRSKSDLNDVFTFVDDILCKEPSLIRPFSQCELNNRFQDTFILWLINKFVKYLSDNKQTPNESQDILLKNIVLQQKILTSCLVNRTLLFKRLVTCYVSALGQLAVEFPEENEATESVQQEQLDESDYLEIDAFTCSDRCLLEIDAEFCFPNIRVNFEHVDAVAQALLRILAHALTIGYDVYPTLFTNSLQMVFRAIKECDFTTKLNCLEYTLALFHKTHDVCPLLEHYYVLTLRALTLMWQQLPMWLQPASSLQNFVQISLNLLKTQISRLTQLRCHAEMFQLGFQLFANIVEIRANSSAQQKSQFTALHEGVINFMLQLQLEGAKGVHLSIAQCGQLMLLTAEHAQLLRLFAASLVQRECSLRTSQLAFMQAQLIARLGEKTLTSSDLLFLKELLTALIFLEHHQCQQQQLNSLKAEPTRDTLKQLTYSNDINLFSVLNAQNWTSQLNAKVEAFLGHSEKTKDLEERCEQFRIAGQLLVTATLRNEFTTQLKRRIINFLNRPLKAVLTQTQSSAIGSDERELAYVALQSLSSICLNDADNRNTDVVSLLQRLLSNIANQLFVPTMTTEAISDLRRAFCHNLPNMIVNGLLQREQIINDFLTSYALQSNGSEVASMLQIVLCSSDLNANYAFLLSPYAKINKSANVHLNAIEIVCQKCTKSEKTPNDVLAYMQMHSAILLQWSPAADINISKLSANLKHTQCILFKENRFAYIANHLEAIALSVDEFLQLLKDSSKIGALNSRVLHTMVPQFIATDSHFLSEMAKFILEQTLKSLQESSSSMPSTDRHQKQLQLLALISCCTAESTQLSEQWLFIFFKITFFFLVHPESEVVQEAVLCATEMCGRYNVQPTQLWNWYKRDALSLIVKLAVYVYLRKGVRLTRSLKAFTKMLGFSCVQEFICKYHRLLTTIILPYCVKEPQCKGILVSISKITRKPVSTLFVVSFLRIYTHIYLTEEAVIGNKCIELIVKCTAFSLNKLMNTDVKQTVSEFLIYFNRNPKFVMQAFQCLLLKEASSTSQRNKTSSSSSIAQTTLTTPTSEFSNFIADRFLGVITYFEICLAEPNFEKPLKEEALYSLGQIIRFVGAHHVTQFRFKIIAMLSFVLSLNDRHLQNICLKIWNVFLHIVNIQELGASLSRIVASLQPLLQHSAEEVNSIYEFVILKNDSLLGAYIPDLYFVENIPEVAPAIRACVARQIATLKGDQSTLLEKLGFLFKQITNENLQVRIYGLTYLRQFIAEHREAINHMILSEIRINPLIENVVEILVAGCRHEDHNLQLASAKCLGELGAIDPSYMPFNYSSELVASELSLSIHTDGFAIMALTELCRAYQFQKDTKYVDNFSLAIQETLSVCGVSPKEKKKLNVWEAIPIRMRQVMEPLLTSCYTGSRRESKCKEHPIFNSNFSRTYGDWAFAWAARLIDFLKSEDTKHLLNSYKPSMRRDNNTLALMFPYVLLHALQDCSTEQMQQIYEEFEAVFSFCRHAQIAKPDYEISGMKEFLSTKYSADLNNDLNRKSNSNLQKEAAENFTRDCTKLCSEQIDFLQRWIREWQRINMIDGKINDANENYKRIEEFLAKFDKYLIARANYNSGEFVRALTYLEEYIEADAKTRLQEQISFLIEIHGQLMDADSVEGAVFKKKTNLNLDEEILINRIVDRPQETVTCYEQLMSSDEQINQDHIKGMIDCYLRMDTPETALLITDGLWHKLTDQYTDDYFKECKSELLWRLGRYDELQELLEDSVVRGKTSNWNIQCAEAFMLFRQPIEASDDSNTRYANFVTKLDNIRNNVLCSMRTCSGVKQNSYPHAYDEVVKLHLLNEVEKNKLLLTHVSACLFKEENETASRKCLEDVTQFFADWDARLRVLQPIVRIMEPMLCFRRNLLIETKRLMCQKITEPPKLLKEVEDLIDTEIGKLWIRSVQMNRDAGSLQQAHLSIMKAEQYAPKSLFIEKAKLLWEKGDQTNSFKLIEENLERFDGKCKGNIRNLDAFDRVLYAEAKFLQATYNAESNNICSELNLRYFKEAILGNRNSEKCHVQLAQYMEKICDSFSQEQKDGDNGRRLILDIMINYAKSLRCGYENVYQSLPRLISIWLDYTSHVASLTESASSSNDSQLAQKLIGVQDIAKKMNELINNSCEVLPTSIFYTAFSQLLSRICHPTSEVYIVLRNIFVKLVEHFPHQSLWMLLPVLKSSYTNRIKRCKLIFTDNRLTKPMYQKLLTDFNMLAERLIELTNKEVAMDQTYQLSTLVKQLPKLFQDPKFSNILLPFEKYMQASFPISSSSSISLNLNLPKIGNSLPDSPSIPTNPFPYKQIFISGIDEEVSVLRSAAKPKKITIRCNDGKHYDVMVKPKDDLRKDFRLMEFNGLVKRYLHQDSQARHRRLRIRTYAAIPFNEECGLVEWLPKLNSFRNICNTIYRVRGMGASDRILRSCVVPKTDPIEKKRDVFINTLLVRNPPIFHEWFRQRFPTPHSWYEARAAYVKTIAVMSIVGYILGLGDRHGENVLFDETSGDAVHVDFNCLFNLGETFAYPELVPFRLTHNMVFAMGPLGVEGMFRKCCEITLRVLKHEAKTLMSVLRPFVYDLVLNRNYSNVKKQTSVEMTDPKAMMDVRRIEERLQGYVKKTLANSMPLSTEGQVSFLINEATDIDNLASMYIGWGAYL